MSNLPKFERAGGLQTSTHRTGDQWDAPFGWAPLQWIAVEGMRRYGYREEADRVSKKFMSAAEAVFRERGTLVEKYDVVDGRRDVVGEVRFGYHTNEAGFGWTNAVYEALYDGLINAAKR
jgi:alpha,alpha-trehalase